MLMVQKYGGTSMGSLERIRNVARRVLAAQRAGHQVVVIVSAMAGETDRLLRLAAELGTTNGRELDVLIATGEQVSIALLAMAICSDGGSAVSFLGHQIRILTDSAFSRARIQRIDAPPLFAALGRGQIPVVAGFQGIDEAGNITTLGRGGSDTSAVAVAAALRADVCEIYTDVDGVYTTDPNLCPDARKIPRISYQEMMELASLGAKVLQIRSVEVASKYSVPLHVRSSFNDQEGTMVVDEDAAMEQVVVAGVSLDANQARITLRGLPARVGLQAELFRALAQSGVVVDIIVQNPPTDGRTNLSFTVPRTDLPQALALLEARRGTLGFAELLNDDRIAKVSIVGVGMRSQPGVAATMFELLAREGVEILMITTSEIKVSCVVDRRYAELAVRVLHEGFKLAAEAGAA